MSSGMVMSDLSMRACSPETTSRRLWGGMRVAMPTAMPEDPLMSRLGTLAGNTRGSSCRTTSHQNLPAQHAP